MEERQAPPEDQEVAIAIKGGGRGSADLPRVVASGRGAIAEQILEIAFAQGVKVRTDADLAEILSAIEVDSEIPLEALATVAEILSYVYRAQGAPEPSHDALEGAPGNNKKPAGADEELHVE